MLNGMKEGPRMCACMHFYTCQLQISLAFSGPAGEGQLHGAQEAAGGAGSQDLRKGARQGKEYKYNLVQSTYVRRHTGYTV